MTDFTFLRESAEIVAPRLLGCILERRIDGKTLRVKIVETEAYDQNDAASHSYRGRTSRTDVMFGPPGQLYVYFTYGMHYCCNVVVGPSDYGAAVLIRAVEPLAGVGSIEKRRGKTGVDATNGPAKLCQALAIDKAMNGHDLHTGTLRLIVQGALPSSAITQTTRIGISQAADIPWRFYITDNPFVSKR